MISDSSILSFTPQNRVDIIGSLLTKELTEECQPRAVPCQVGPDFSIMSSGLTKVSEEEVRKLYEEKSEENWLVAS